MSLEAKEIKAKINYWGCIKINSFYTLKKIINKINTQNSTSKINKTLCFLKIFKNLFMREREREAETQEEGEADSMLGARRRTRSWDSRITSWAKGRR